MAVAVIGHPSVRKRLFQNHIPVPKSMSSFILRVPKGTVPFRRKTSLKYQTEKKINGKFEDAAAIHNDIGEWIPDMPTRERPRWLPSKLSGLAVISKNYGCAYKPPVPTLPYGDRRKKN